MATRPPASVQKSGEEGHQHLGSVNGKKNDGFGLFGVLANGNMNSDFSPALPSCLADAEVADRKEITTSDNGNAELLALVMANDKEGINEWVGRWFKDNGQNLYQIAFRTLVSSGLTSDAADAVYDVMAKVLDKLERFEGRSSFKTWVTTILIRHCLDLVRDAIREQRMREFFGIWREQVGDDGFVTDEQVAKLELAMTKLAGNEKIVITLFYFEGLSESEVAAKLNRSIGSVSSLKRRTVLKLREIFDDGPGHGRDKAGN